MPGKAKRRLTEAKWRRMHTAKVKVVCHTHNEIPRWTLAANKERANFSRRLPRPDLKLASAKKHRRGNAK